MPLSLYAVLSVLLYIFILFLSSFLGTINSLNSSLQLFLQAFYGCIFVFFSTIRIKPSLQKLFIVLCVLIASFLFIGHSISPSTFSFLSTDSYQFILRIRDEHNHLGDLAGLGFIALIINPASPIITGLLLIFVIVIMAVSFSKSAFLGVLVVSSIMAFQKKGYYRIGFFVMLCISTAIISIYTTELSQIPPIQAGQKIMMQTLHLNPKQILSVRDSYYPQVFRAWKEAPLEQSLFGYGPGNYVYPSMKTGTTIDLTPAETHNLLLSIFIESGFLSLFWFLIFCSLILFIGLKQKNPSVYLFAYLLVNFQTDFTYVIPFFMALFFFFASQVVFGKNKSNNEKVARGVFAALILLFAVYSGVVYFSLRQIKNNLETQLTSAIIRQDRSSIQKTVQNLERLTPYEESELVHLSSIEEAFGNTTEAIRLLEKLSSYSPHWYLLYLPHELDLKQKEGTDIKRYLEKKKKDFALFPFSIEEKNKLNTLCQERVKIRCVK